MLLAFAAVAAGQVTELQFTFTELLNTPSTASEIQLSELKVFDASGVQLPVVNVSNPGGTSPSDSQAPTSATDGSVDTKWVDEGFGANGQSVLLMTALGDVASFEMFTANDNSKRDPVALTVSAKSLCGFMVPIATYSGLTPPSTYKTTYGSLSLSGHADLEDTTWCHNSSTYRLTFTELSGPAPVDGVGLSEVKLYGIGGVEVDRASLSFSNPNGVTHVNQAADKLNDGLLTEKWMDTGFSADDSTVGTSSLVITTPYMLMESYELFTNPDTVAMSQKSDPVHVLFERMDGAGNYVLVSDTSGLTPPPARGA